MNEYNYEIVLIVNPNLDNDNIRLVKEKITNIINSYGKITKFENMGKRRLAYKVHDFETGIYFVFEYEFEAEKDEVKNIAREIESKCHTINEVLKLINVRIND